MTMKSTLSVVALAAALGFSGTAFGQDLTFNGTAIAAEDLPEVEQRCLDLVNAETNESIIEDDNTGGEESADSDSEGEDKPSDDADGSASATADSTEEVNEVAQATTTIDLETITVEWCTENNLGGAM